MLKIVKYPNEVLRQVAEKIESNDLEVRRVLNVMTQYIEDDSNNAAGLALPQLGISKRGFVMFLKKKAVIMINPKLIKVGNVTSVGHEGCLSIEGEQKPVKRSRKIEISYETIDGKMKKDKLTDWDARVFLHELDHLDGKLYIDYIK